MMKARSNQRAANRADRLARAALMCGPDSKICPPERATELLEAIIEPGDRVVIEGDNQKQADFLAAALAKADPAHLHDLHMVQSVLALPDHFAVFARGIANRLDFAFAGPQSRRLAEQVASGSVKIGAIHTYLELYARMLVDLTPRVALVVADKADRHGNLYTGPNTEDTPMIVEAAAFGGGVVVTQVNEIVEHLPRVDIPGDWVDVVVPSPVRYAIEPLFTRDPAKIRENKLLMAMMAIAEVYDPYEIRRLNHGIGYATAAIELLLPTFGAARGLKGKLHFVLNPHPTLIPAIEAGFVESVYCFGSELGMERYVPNAPTYFPSGQTVICDPTAHWRRRPANMRATSSSARPSRLMRRATVRRQPRDGSPPSACRPTWAQMREGAGIAVQPGCTRASRQATAPGAASLSCRWSRPASQMGCRASWSGSTRSVSLQQPGS